MDPASCPDVSRPNIYLNDVNRHLGRLHRAIEGDDPDRVNEALLAIHDAIASLRNMVAEVPVHHEVTLPPSPLPLPSISPGA